MTNNIEQRELDAIDRFVKESGNACGWACHAYVWNSERKQLTIFEEGGHVSQLTGRDIAEHTHDERLAHLL